MSKMCDSSMCLHLILFCLLGESHSAEYEKLIQFIYLLIGRTAHIPQLTFGSAALHYFGTNSIFKRISSSHEG